MDDRHDNIDPEDLIHMNGHRDSPMNAEEQAVFAKLFALDQQPGPSPQFIAGLGKSLMPSAGRNTLLSATTSTEETLVAPQPQAGASGGGKRRRPFISYGSAAVLMVIVILVGYAVTLWAVDSSNDPPAYMGFASTFEATGTVAAEGCYIEPRTIDYITMIIEYAITGSPEGLHGMPQYDIGEPWPPAEAPDTTSILGTKPSGGTPVDEETASRVSEVFSQFVACYNNNEQLPMYALFTDDGLARRFVPNGVLEFRFITALSAPPQAQTSGLRPDMLQRIEMLPDGRVVAFLDDFGTAIIFKEVDGRWLIDDTNMGRG